MSRFSRYAVATAVCALSLLTCGRGKETRIVDDAKNEADVLRDQSVISRQVPYAAWDVDRDHRLDRHEFAGWNQSRGTWRQWDADNDSTISEPEFTNDIFALWDENEDERVTHLEWSEDAALWFEEAALTEWEDWDTNGDDSLNEEEFTGAVVDYGFYHTWDADDDAALEMREFDSGLFAVFDANDNRYVDEREWQTADAEWQQ